MAFASNKNAYGICDITGFRYRLRDMKKTWDGLFVVYSNIGSGKLGSQLTTFEVTASVGSVTVTTT